MTDSERNELEAIDPEERARLLGRKDKFVLSSKTAEIIVNDLFRGDDDDAKLGRLFRDLVAFNVDGSTDLIDNADSNDKCDITARHLLYNDSNVFISKWLLTSRHNAENRIGKTKDSKTEPKEAPAPASTNGEYYRPTLDEVKEQARMCLGDDEVVVEQVANRWLDKETKNNWLDDRGEPVRNWRKVFKSYCDKAWLLRAVPKDKTL